MLRSVLNMFLSSQIALRPLIKDWRFSKMSILGREKNIFLSITFFGARARQIFFFLKKGLEHSNPISYISESAPPLRNVLFRFLTSGVGFGPFFKCWKDAKIEIFHFWSACAHQNFCLKKLMNISYISEKESWKSVH